MVYSSSYIYALERTGDGFAFLKKQTLFSLLGMFALIIGFNTNYRRLARYHYAVLGTVLFLLVLVFVPGIGAKVGGAQRWLRLGFFNFQPGELAKFGIIFFVAKQLDRKQDQFNTFTKSILSHFLIPAPLFILLLLQPDFGTTAMIILVLFCLLFLSGVPWKYFLSSVGAALLAGLVLAFTSPYRLARISTFLNPWKDPSGKGFQILQSFVGLYNGNLFGVGLGNGKEKLFYLPEAHNDFIFSVIGEELGFVGVFSLITAFVFFIYRGLKIAWNCEKLYGDRFGMLLGSGITLALGLQGLVNMAVVLGILPTKGLNLPFISYGGSALLVDLFAVGILLSISKGASNSKKVNP